jgi:polyisoprenoid-binding protein YceI
MKRIRPAIALICAVALLAGANSRAGQIRLIRDESSVTYHMTHVLHKVNATSDDVEYQVTLDSLNRVSLVAAEVDVTTFNSGNSNRDSHAMEVIDAISYPAATYTSSKVVQRGDSLLVDGKLTFHGVSKDVEMTGTAKWSADTLKVNGAFPVSLTQFKIERPAFLMVPVQDTVWFEVKAAFQTVK